MTLTTILLLGSLFGFLAGCGCLIAANRRLGNLANSDQERQVNITAFRKSLDIYEELARDLEAARVQADELERLNLQHRINTLP